MKNEQGKHEAVEMLGAQARQDVEVALLLEGKDGNGVQQLIAPDVADL